jgi:hypothetical protein
MKLRYSLRTLLILMLLVGPLCIWGWPAYESWRDERARLAKEAAEIKLLQQRISTLNQQVRVLGGSGTPALSGSESLNDLREVERRLITEILTETNRRWVPSRITTIKEKTEPLVTAGAGKDYPE